MRDLVNFPANFMGADLSVMGIKTTKTAAPPFFKRGTAVSDLP